MILGLKDKFSISTFMTYEMAMCIRSHNKGRTGNQTDRRTGGHVYVDVREYLSATLLFLLLKYFFENPYIPIVPHIQQRKLKIKLNFI